MSRPTPSQTGITGKDCNTYPAYPGCVPTTELPRTHPGTALTGQELHDPIAAFLILGSVGLLALLGSLRYWARFRFVKR